MAHLNKLSRFGFWGPPAGYILVALAATWPLATHLRGWVPGLGDWGQNMWALWWTRQALLVLGQSPFFTNYLFYPQGVTLLFHPVDISDGLLVMPLWGLLGGDVCYNLLILLSFGLGGWGAYLLALQLTGQRWAGFVAGLVFALSPYHFLRIQLGHLNLSTLQWIPFYALFLLRFVQRGSRRSAVLAVFFLALMALNSWYYVVYCGLLSLAVIFWPSARRFEARQLAAQAGRVALVLLAALIVLSPVLVSMARLLSSTTLVGEHNPLRHSVDLYSFWVPGPPLSWASRFEDVWISYAAQNREPGASAYLGYVALGLSVIGLAARRWRRQSVWWLALAAGFTALALGPQLQIDGQGLPVTLPYHWLVSLVPAFAITGIPGRFVVMTSLALAMLAGCGAAWLLSRAGSNRWWLGLGLSLLIAVEYVAVPLPLSRTDLAPFYQTIGADRAAYAIIDMKWDANFLMHAQTVHSKPIIGGWLARLPAEQAANLDQGSLDKILLALLLGADRAAQVTPATLRADVQAALTARHVRYIIDHQNQAGPWLQQFVGWPVVYKSDDMVVYAKD